MRSLALLALGFVLGLGVALMVRPSSDRTEVGTSDEMERAVRDAMREVSAFDRSRTLSQVLAGLNAGNVDGAVRGMRSDSDHLEPIDMQLLLSAWTRFDAFGALSAAERWPSKSGREIGMRMVMREWAASGRVLDAVNYYQTLQDPETRAMLAGPLLRGWAMSGDFDGALERARRIWELGEAEDSVDGFVRGALTALGPEALLERISSLQDAGSGDFEQRLMRSTLNLSAREVPAAAAGVYSELAGETLPDWLHGAMKVIALSWAENDPRAAIEWLLTQSDRAERTVALKEIMRSWTLRDLDAAWGWWLAENEESDAQGIENAVLRSILLAPALRSMAEFRPVEASKWVEQVTKPAARMVLIQRIAHFWTLRDPDPAQVWVDGLGLSDEDAARVAETIARARSVRLERAAEDSRGESARPDARPAH